MSLLLRQTLSLVAVALLSGCSTYVRHGLEPERARQVELSSRPGNSWSTPELEDRILALNPMQVSDRDVRDVLAHAPAPRIISIHGGVYPVHRWMISFCHFLVGMGYPETSVRHLGDGTYTFSCYESSKKIAGMTAWYYEHEGLRPMLVGHSQGGMQVVKVLDKLASNSPNRLRVWNPLTWKAENRRSIRDPLTGQMRPVAGLRLPYATSVGAGGLARLMPNQWDMCGRLRTIPDSVEEFTGFYKGADLLGGDYLGYGPANHFHAAGQARVRNLTLPSWYRHTAVPDTQHLLASEPIRDWLNGYQPSETPTVVPNFDADSRNILWAADVWYSIKKHWVLELQNLIRAHRNQPHGS